MKVHCLVLLIIAKEVARMEEEKGWFFINHSVAFSLYLILLLIK